VRRRERHVELLEDVAGRVDVQNRRDGSMLQPDAAFAVRDDSDRCARLDVSQMRPVLEHPVRIVHCVPSGELDGGRQVATAAILPPGTTPLREHHHSGGENYNGSHTKAPLHGSYLRHDSSPDYFFSAGLT
jgi:hypothetical protein